LPHENIAGLQLETNEAQNKIVNKNISKACNEFIFTASTATFESSCNVGGKAAAIDLMCWP